MNWLPFKKKTISWALVRDTNPRSTWLKASNGTHVEIDGPPAEPQPLESYLESLPARQPLKIRLVVAKGTAEVTASTLLNLFEQCQKHQRPLGFLNAATLPTTLIQMCQGLETLPPNLTSRSTALSFTAETQKAITALQEITKGIPKHSTSLDKAHSQLILWNTRVSTHYLHQQLQQHKEPQR